MKVLSPTLALSLFGTVTVFSAIGTGSAQAASVSYSASTGDFTTTNWTKNLEVSKFNTKLGTLTGITFDLTADIQGTVKFENESAKAATITSQLKSSVKVSSADLFGLPLIESVPLYQAVQNVGKYDKTRDFTGTSGFTSGLLTASDSDNKLYDSTNPFFSLLSQAVSGKGNIAFALDAAGLSNVTGSGNITSNFTNVAKANLTVTYSYDAAPTKGVPEPKVLVGCVLAGILGFKFRKRYQQSQTKFPAD